MVSSVGTGVRNQRPSQDLRTGCLGSPELGDEVATALQRRLGDLEAAETITELPWLNIDFGANDDAAIEFYPGYWLTILAIRGAAEMDRTQKVDWTIVDRIKLTGIRRP